jgi:hypothetical protein
MSIKKRVAFAAFLTVCAAGAGVSGESSAATQTACDVLPAAQVSKIVGQAVYRARSGDTGIAERDRLLVRGGSPDLAAGHRLHGDRSRSRPKREGPRATRRRAQTGRAETKRQRR